MNFELVELEELSGRFAKIYTIYLIDKEKCLYDEFIEENSLDYPKEVEKISDKLSIMGNKYGVLDHYFRLDEGMPGDKVCALLKNPGFKLRLYCIKFEDTAVILGNGGFKQSGPWQNYPKLRKKVPIIMEISAIIHQALARKQLFLNSNGEFSGKMTYSTSE